MGAGEGLVDGRVGEPTCASCWYAVGGGRITDELLEWPPDLFAVANVVLARAEAFRFALSPVEMWPPGRHRGWAHAVEEAGRQLSVWVEDRTAAMPELLVEEWGVFRERADTPVLRLATGGDSRLCEALLTVHAIADEACAGLGVALDTSNADASVYRARGRELLARKGSLARIDARLLRVLPKVRTPPTGRPAFSRYVCVQGPGVEVRWHKIPARHRGTDLRSEYATLLLLPWPLRVRASDFHPIEGSLQRLPNDPFGFFEFVPAEGLDLDLLDRVLVAARKEAGSVDVVVLPESAVDEREIEDLETLLQGHGVAYLNTGVRGRPRQPGRFPGNWLHIGINPRLEKGGPALVGDPESWFHIRQNKHHRWSLDEGQLTQYHLGGVLHPHVRWWEAMEVPRLAMQFVELAELTQASLVCEDLAQNDDIAQLIRSVGPTVVICGLLDGPQLDSRWAARYASVLADDPGSAVLTLASLGMVQRSRPQGRERRPRHAPPHRPRTFWKPRNSPSLPRRPRVWLKPRPTHPNASTPCSPTPMQTRPGEPSSGFRDHPPDSPTRWNPSAESFALLLTSHPAHRAATKCSPQSATTTPAKELDRLVRRSLLAMLEERATRQSTQAHKAR